jgi:antitoxin component HigA of HigAB toxin-antitoxin module
MDSTPGTQRGDDLEVLGVAEVLNRRRPLSIEMIRKLHEGLGISAEILIRPYAIKKSAALEI